MSVVPAISVTSPLTALLIELICSAFTSWTLITLPSSVTAPLKLFVLSASTMSFAPAPAATLAVIPLTVTSVCVGENAEIAPMLYPATVPVATILKSVASTPVTASEKVTRKVTEPGPVTAAMGACRFMLSIYGGNVSTS